ncbi:MAG: right-handed parallel beta-helix repeat-containing protein [Thermoleophilia bacterium]
MAAGQLTIVDGDTNGACAQIGAWDQYSLTCTLTADQIGTTISIGSNNITIDGNGHMLNGGGAYGVYNDGFSGVTIKNLVLTNFSYGVFLCFNGNNNVIGNTVTNSSEEGIALWGSSSNTIEGNTVTNSYWDGIGLIFGGGNNLVRYNTIANNQWGVWVAGSSNNTIYNNNFIDNTYQADADSAYTNDFNSSLPAGGNYWSNWTGPDANGDGFVDAPYTAGIAGTDYLPRTTMNSWCTSAELSVSRPAPYWASLGDYQLRNLSVDYTISNSAAAEAYGVSIVGTVDTGGVTSLPPMPSLGNITPGASASFTILYNVPPGVSAFRSTVYATASDSCGNPRSYPGPWPGA